MLEVNGGVGGGSVVQVDIKYWLVVAATRYFLTSKLDFYFELASDLFVKFCQKIKIKY